LALALALIAGGAIVLSSHPRAILLLPVAILACVRAIERRALALTAAGAIAVFAFVSFNDFNLRLSCPGDANVRAVFSMESLSLAVSDHALLAYVSRLAHLLLDHPGLFLFLSQFDFLDSYTSDIFPAYPYRLTGSLISFFLSEFVLLLALGGFAAFVLAAIDCVRRREGLMAVFAVASSWLIILVSIVARTTRNNYEAELMEPLLILTAVLSIWVGRKELVRILGETRVLFFARALFGALIVLSITSQIALLWGYVPSAESAWARPGYVQGQLVSASVHGYSSISGKILSAAARCRIKPSANLQHLMLDEVTYYQFRHSKAPLLMTNMDPRGWGRGIADLHLLLAQKGSDGAIIGCHWLPQDFLSDAIRTGAFCCIPKTKI
jgi:hypothetical protein